VDSGGGCHYAVAPYACVPFLVRAMAEFLVDFRFWYADGITT
jgi:hypothetical protein